MGSADSFLYLSSDEVADGLATLDPLAVIRDALIKHALGDTRLPLESHLTWPTRNGGSARSLGMPAFLSGEEPAAGVKVINANIENPSRGLPRAAGLMILFDPDTARPACILDAPRISALRTAAVSVLAIGALDPPPDMTIAVIGAGTIARAHLKLLHRLPPIGEVILFDVVRERAQGLASDLLEAFPSVEVASGPEQAIRRADAVVTATTVTEGYIANEWLRPGTILLNVSLDDPLPEVVENADLLVVDDWKLVKADGRRLFGRMHRSDLLHGPDEPEARDSTRSRRVETTVGEILLGRHPGRRRGETVLVNPFGLAIEDLALSIHVYRWARDEGVGTWLGNGVA